MSRSMQAPRPIFNYRELAQADVRTFMNCVVAHYAVALVVLFALLSGIDLPGRTDLEDYSSPALLLNAVLIAPVVETLLFQVLFHSLGVRLRLGFWSRVALTFLPFAAAHFLIDVGTGLFAGTLLGFYLAYVYVARAGHSIRQAFVVCAGFHALNNFIFVSLIIIGRQGW